MDDHLRKMKKVKEKHEFFLDKQKTDIEVFYKKLFIVLTVQ